MVERNWTRGIALAAVAGGLALALVAAPLAPGAALAKGASENGVDNSGGKAGGNGKGNGGGGGGSGTTTFVDSDSDSHGKGHTGHGKGHSKDAVSGVLSSNGIEDSATSELLGRLNAAHASDQAKAVQLDHMDEDKSPSAVGLIAAYERAIEAAEEIEAERPRGVETDPQRGRAVVVSVALMPA